MLPGRGRGFRGAAVIAALFVFAGCSPQSAPGARVRGVEAADLSRYERFAFIGEMPMVRRSLSFPELDAPRADTALRSAIARELSGKGYIQVARETADILIAYSLDLKEFVEVDENSIHNFSTRDWRGGGRSPPRVEATVTIWIAEKETGTELWRSKARIDWHRGQMIEQALARAASEAFRTVDHRQK